MLDYVVTLIPSIVTVLYGATSVCYLLKGEYSWALVWGSYATANLGLIFSSK